MRQKAIYPKYKFSLTNVNLPAGFRRVKKGERTISEDYVWWGEADQIEKIKEFDYSSIGYLVDYNPEDCINVFIRKIQN